MCLDSPVNHLLWRFIVKRVNSPYVLDLCTHKKYLFNRGHQQSYYRAGNFVETVVIVTVSFLQSENNGNGNSFLYQFFLNAIVSELFPGGARITEKGLYTKMITFFHKYNSQAPAVWSIFCSLQLLLPAADCPIVDVIILLQFSSHPVFDGNTFHCDSIKHGYSCVFKFCKVQK